MSWSKFSLRFLTNLMLQNLDKNLAPVPISNCKQCKLLFLFDIKHYPSLTGFLINFVMHPDVSWKGVFSISSIVTMTAFVMLRAMVSPNMTSKIFRSGGGVVALIALMRLFWFFEMCHFVSAQLSWLWHGQMTLVTFVRFFPSVHSHMCP